jgi:hypothetical protein
VVVLRLPRQGQTGRGLPLNARLWLIRIAWLVAIWAASVAALALAAGLMRLLMHGAGMR